MISASIGADLPIIPRESAVFSRVCKATSLRDRPLSRHCEGVCTPDTMVCALVRGSPKDIRGEIEGSKPLIFMHFHGVFLALHQKSFLHRIFRSENRSLWSRKSLQNEAKKVLLTDGSAY